MKKLDQEEFLRMKSGILFSFITAVLFVTLEPVSKLIAGSVDPFVITFCRFVIGAFVLLPSAILAMKKSKIKIGLKDLGVMTLLGILFICISMSFLQVGIKIADSPALIAIIFSSNSVFTILFALIILREKVTLNKAIALVLGVVGVIICADFSSGSNLLSVLFGVLAALTFSLYTVLGKKFSKNVSGAVQPFFVFLTGSLVLGIILLVCGFDVVPEFTVKNVSILLYLGLFCSGIGYACYLIAIEKGGVIMGSLAFFIKPILTPFVTLLINGIKPGFKEFIAVAFIVAASYFAGYKNKIKGRSKY